MMRVVGLDDCGSVSRSIILSREGDSSEGLTIDPLSLEMLLLLPCLSSSIESIESDCLNQMINSSTNTSRHSPSCSFHDRSVTSASLPLAAFREAVLTLSPQ